MFKSWQVEYGGEQVVMAGRLVQVGHDDLQLLEVLLVRHALMRN